MSFKLYWALWALGSFLAFIVPELWAAFTGRGKDTLTFTLYDMMGFHPGDPLTKWTATHFLIGGILTVGLIWLIGHLVFGIWVQFKGLDGQ